MNDAQLLPHIRLKFNIDYPSLEECYLFGYECALADISESENPYMAGSKESEEWIEGWWAGFYGEQPLYDLATIKTESNIVKAANDQLYYDKIASFFNVIVEVTSVLAASAVVAYQLIDLVA